MNDFTKKELEHLHDAVREYDCTDWQDDLSEKIQSMIDNHSPFNTNQIAQSHLQEAESLIGHAMCLLGMRDE